ncbi:hypothetical protein C7408_105271 [Paraburkholderia caballeronis]|nr:hypothetical protein C7408_105271 [Paraburkholderia caballeronis]TDV19047.1 hypothetical protein C7406_104317 [Paraburkholderia caballeronis]TDV27180.1 hypothetical protein C7404_105271 [Paraburkholderia caballeronis]
MFHTTPLDGLFAPLEKETASLMARRFHYTGTGFHAGLHLTDAHASVR